MGRPLQTHADELSVYVRRLITLASENYRETALRSARTHLNPAAKRKRLRLQNLTRTVDIPTDGGEGKDKKCHLVFYERSYRSFITEKKSFANN